MTVRVEVEPSVLEWAVRRSGRTDDDLWSKANPRERFDAWLNGSKQPTYKQLQAFAQRTYTPFGYLLLDEPPQEEPPIPDFRQVAGKTAAKLSANLLDVIYSCQDRLEWWRSHRQLIGEPPPTITGSTNLKTPPQQAATNLAERLGWTAEIRRSSGSWSNALSGLRDRAEDLGVLVVISGVVGANNRRLLDVDEFRGFALIDRGDALVFVNGRDAKSAQIFTLAHELAHIMLATEGISSLDRESIRDVTVERWCNSVAAELLVPEDEFHQAFQISTARQRPDQLEELAKHFRVSTLVVLGRFLELGYMDWDRYLAEAATEYRRIAELPQRKSSGGDYYKSRPVQLSKRFSRELIGSTLEGHTPYTEAFRLLGVRKAATFDSLAEQLGVV